ncbi:MAG TPA: hypothetical protein PK522_00835 [Nitrosomonas sp.]|nr:hypothetical protein [Nitrosomonas sp.]
MIGFMIFLYMVISAFMFFAMIDEGAEVCLAWAIFWPLLLGKKACIGFVKEWNDL